MQFAAGPGGDGGVGGLVHQPAKFLCSLAQISSATLFFARQVAQAVAPSAFVALQSLLSSQAHALMPFASRRSSNGASISRPTVSVLVTRRFMAPYVAGARKGDSCSSAEAICSAGSLHAGARPRVLLEHAPARTGAGRHAPVARARALYDTRIRLTISLARNRRAHGRS